MVYIVVMTGSDYDYYISIYFYMCNNDTSKKRGG